MDVNNFYAIFFRFWVLFKILGIKLVDKQKTSLVNLILVKLLKLIIKILRNLYGGRLKLHWKVEGACHLTNYKGDKVLVFFAVLQSKFCVWI